VFANLLLRRFFDQQRKKARYLYGGFWKLAIPNVEEQLAKIEREIELLREKRKTWPISQVDEKYKGDEVLEEIFRLAKEDRDKERKREQE